MSNNVIDLFGGSDFKGCSYYIDEKGDEYAGVSMRDRSLIMIPLNLNEIEVYLNGESNVYDRKTLSEFLHVATTLLDSEDRERPTGDMVGIDYT